MDTSEIIRVYSQSLTQLPYLGVLLAILLSGHPIPIPEAVTLIILGYLSAEGILDLLPLIVVAIFATILIDLIFYELSRTSGRLLHLKDRITKSSYMKQFTITEEKHLFFLIFVSHFVPGWRLANPIASGITGMPQGKFILYTTVTSLFHVPFFILLGRMLYEQVGILVGSLLSLQQAAMLVLVIAFFAIIKEFYAQK